MNLYFTVTHFIPYSQPTSSKTNFCLQYMFNCPLRGKLLSTPVRRVLHEKLIVAQRNYPTVMKQKVRCRLNASTVPGHVLNQVSLVHILTSFWYKICYNTIIPSTPRSPKWLFPSDFTIFQFLLHLSTFRLFWPRFSCLSSGCVCEWWHSPVQQNVALPSRSESSPILCS